MNRDIDSIGRALGTALVLLGVGGLGAGGYSSLASAQPAPKATLVVVGDPDEELRAAANRVRESAAGVVRFPSDPALEAALQGVNSAEDGLDRIRAERRSLGLDEAADVPTLTRLGQLTASDLLLLVRSGGGRPVLLAFHVEHAGFLAGTLSLPEASEAQIRRFVADRTGDPRPVPDSAGGGSAASDPVSTTAAAAVQPAAVAGAATEGLDPTDEDEATWFERHWPFLAGGLLLLGVVVWFAWPDGDEPAPPTLRFVPGGQ